MENMNIYYDEGGDFLEITAGDISNCFFDNLGGGIFQIVDKKTGEVKGVVIHSFKTRTQKLNEIKPKTKELLVQSKEDAFVSKDLATIIQDVPMDFNLQDCSWNNYDKAKATQSMESFGFHSLIPRLP